MAIKQGGAAAKPAPESNKRPGEEALMVVYHVLHSQITAVAAANDQVLLEVLVSVVSGQKAT